MHVERILVILSALVCALFLGSLRDTRSRMLLSARTDVPPVPESITLRPGKVLISVENDAGAPLESVSVRVLSIQDDRAYLAGAARTDARARPRWGPFRRAKLGSWRKAKGRLEARSGP
jgi:hypothetical protein